MGDVCADFFCGCGTTISAAENLGRRWIGVDAAKQATSVIRKRMISIQVSLQKVNILSLFRNGRLRAL